MSSTSGAGLLHGGEVAAAVELGPVHDVRMSRLGEAADRQEMSFGNTATPTGTLIGSGAPGGRRLHRGRAAS